MWIILFKFDAVKLSIDYNLLKYKYNIDSLGKVIMGRFYILFLKRDNIFKLGKLLYENLPI